MKKIIIALIAILVSCSDSKPSKKKIFGIRSPKIQEQILKKVDELIANTDKLHKLKPNFAPMFRSDAIITASGNSAEKLSFDLIPGKEYTLLFLLPSRAIANEVGFHSKRKRLAAYTQKIENGPYNMPSCILLNETEINRILRIPKGLEYVATILIHEAVHFEQHYVLEEKGEEISYKNGADERRELVAHNVQSLFLETIFKKEFQEIKRLKLTEIETKNIKSQKDLGKYVNELDRINNGKLGIFAQLFFFIDNKEVYAKFATTKHLKETH